MGVLPFGNQVERIEVTGQTLLDALTHSVARFIPGSSGSGRFLQMSGIQQCKDISVHSIFDISPFSNRSKNRKVTVQRNMIRHAWLPLGVAFFKFGDSLNCFLNLSI